MSEIEPVEDTEVFYQAKHKTAEMWHLCSKEDFSDLKEMSWMDVRILWTSESVLKKLSITFKKHAAAYKVLKAENEAQAKRIAELEDHVTKLGSGSRQHLYKAFARRYKEILSLRKENEALRKQVEEHKELMQEAENG